MMQISAIEDVRLAVIGLGYVGLPLAAEFAKQRPVCGFDINPARVAQINAGTDVTNELDAEEFAAARYLRATTELEDLRDCNVYIVTVPTPIDANKRPDLTPLILASRAIGEVLAAGDIVIYESTVYPGATEQDCVPELERISGLRFNQDFFAGYSPERINPGDRVHRISSIQKVTSGSTPAVAELVDQLYASIITAGTHKTSSIMVAEAAKVIENTQRDLNIALMNELSVLFDRLGIDTLEVLRAAGTKWNFLPFRPGLVGGHCIGVDPYYLTDKAEKVGYTPQVILAGRRINDEMGRYIARTTVKKMLQNQIDVASATIGVLGLTFKENCPDLRNSKVIDIIDELQDFGLKVIVDDPLVDTTEVAQVYPSIQLGKITASNPVDVLIVAVAHDQFAQLRIADLTACLKGKKSMLLDLKGVFEPDQFDAEALVYWRL